MKELFEMLGNLQNMQDKLGKLGEMQSLGDITLEGVAGGDMVKVSLGGEGEIKSIFIAPELMKKGEEEILADLIIAAHQQAKKQFDEKLREKTMELSKSLPELLPEILGDLKK